jgi:hypothetical protein
MKPSLWALWNFIFGAIFVGLWGGKILLDARAKDAHSEIALL